MSILGFLNSKMKKGGQIFTTEEYRTETNSSLVAAQNAIRRAKERGEVATPYRGFHVIVPPEYRSLGCLPAERFVPALMKHLGESYYVGLLSAASYYGASHHAPQSFQVVVANSRPPMRAGKIVISFVVRHNVAEMATTEKKTPTGMMKISTPEQTAFDLVSYMTRCGGLDNVATVLADLVESLASGKLRDVAESVGPVRNAQRLGYLLGVVGAKGKAYALSQYIADIRPKMAKLDPQNTLEGDRDKTWRIIVNTKVEPDL